MQSLCGDRMWVCAFSAALGCATAVSAQHDTEWVDSGGGAFTDPDNWMDVPADSGLIGLFNLASTYTVDTFPATIGGLIIENGVLTFDLGAGVVETQPPVSGGSRVFLDMSTGAATPLLAITNGEFAPDGTLTDVQEILIGSGRSLYLDSGGAINASTPVGLPNYAMTLDGLLGIGGDSFVTMQSIEGMGTIDLSSGGGALTLRDLAAQNVVVGSNSQLYVANSADVVTASILDPNLDAATIELNSATAELDLGLGGVVGSLMLTGTTTTGLAKAGELRVASLGLSNFFLQVGGESATANTLWVETRLELGDPDPSFNAGLGAPPLRSYTIGQLTQHDDATLRVELGEVGSGAAAVELFFGASLAGALEIDFDDTVDPSTFDDTMSWTVMETTVGNVVTDQHSVVYFAGGLSSGLLFTIKTDAAPATSLIVDVDSFADAGVEFGTSTSTSLSELPRNADAADLNGDGIDDIALTFDTLGQVQVWKRDPASDDDAPTFNGGALLSTGANPVGLDIGDVDNDTILDVAVTNKDDNSVSLYIGDGLGNIIPAPAPGDVLDGADGVFLNSPTSIVVDDINVDTLSDLTITNEGDDSVSIYVADGLGGFTLYETLTDSDGRRPKSVKPSGTFDESLSRDSGDQDLVVLYEGIPIAPPMGIVPGRVSIFEGVDPQGAGPEYVLAAGVNVGLGANSLAVGDLDGDLLEDIVVADLGGVVGARPVEGELVIIFNASAPGAIALSDPHMINVGAAPREVTVVDIDEDGDLDIACIVGPLGGGFIRIIENTTDPAQNARLVLHHAADIATATPPVHLLAMDVDGDGDNELVSLNDAATVRTHIDPSIESHQNLAISGNPADLNGDGVVDGADLAALLAAWGACPLPMPPGCAADFNADGNIDGADLAQLLASWT